MLGTPFFSTTVHLFGVSLIHAITLASILIATGRMISHLPAYTFGPGLTTQFRLILHSPRSRQTRLVYTTEARYRSCWQVTRQFATAQHRNRQGQSLVTSPEVPRRKGPASKVEVRTEASRNFADIQSPPQPRTTRARFTVSHPPLLEPLASDSPTKAGASDKPYKNTTTRDAMSSSIEIITTPTADTSGTTLVLRTGTKNYVFGSLAEGTQRAIVQQGTRLLKAQDFFLTGRSEWKNMGGLIGMMLTLADSSTSSYTTSMDLHRRQQSRGKTGAPPAPPHFNIYGPPNLKYTLGTCRRFIFRKGIPINATEYVEQFPSKDAEGNIVPTWQDSNIQVWAMSVTPTSQGQDAHAEAVLETRRRRFDAHLNTFMDHQAPENESAEDREARYDSIRSATIKFMFDSNWSFDTLVERHISEVEMPATMFVRNPNTHAYEPYNGPKPGGSEPLPDMTVFTRTPWPGARILALPPTKPAAECISYIVRTHPSRGAFDVVRAKALGVKRGPDYSKLTAGLNVQNQDGEWIKPEQVVGPNKPGQGIAILDVPSLDYLESLIQREEFSSSQVMNGIEAFVWNLGPGVAGSDMFKGFQTRMANVQHIISSVDVSPNRITYDSVAGQATRLGQVDPARYSTPVYDSQMVPQRTLDQPRPRESSCLSNGAIAADRGMSFTLMPKFATKTETISALFQPSIVRQETAPEVLELAKIAKQSVQDNRATSQAWRQLLARPDTEITTLGTGSALPSKYRNVSATLVRVPGVGNYLFDCGENTLGQLSRVFPVDELIDILKNLRVIWISHLHADHHLGTASVIRAWYHLVHGGRPNPQALDGSGTDIDPRVYGLSVISHAGMLQWLREYSAVEDFGYSRILPLTTMANRKSSILSILNSFAKDEVENFAIHKEEYERLFGFTDIQFARVAHCVGAMAVSITFPHSPSDAEGVNPLKVSYSGDCRPSTHFAKIGSDTTVLIHEATFDDELQGDAIAKKHSTTSEALGIGAQMNAKAVVLTHFSQRYQKIPVLQTVTDGEAEDPLLDPRETAEEVNDDVDGEVDPTIEHADNMDMHPSVASISEASTRNVPSLQHQTSSLHENERIIKVRNRDMKVAIAFDYMRVKIGEIIELDKFNEALNALLIEEETQEDVSPEDGVINANGKKTSGDETGGNKKKQKRQWKMNRNN
jgi:ribonuclease Z